MSKALSIVCMSDFNLSSEVAVTSPADNVPVTLTPEVVVANFSPPDDSSQMKQTVVANFR